MNCPRCDTPMTELDNGHICQYCGYALIPGTFGFANYQLYVAIKAVEQAMKDAIGWPWIFRLLDFLARLFPNKETHN